MKGIIYNSYSELKRLRYIYILLPLLCWSCSSEVLDEKQDQQLITIDGSAFNTEIVPFVVEEDGVQTRANMAGNQFETNDLIRLRVICPYSNYTEYGESTWGGTYDNWRLYYWQGDQKQWLTVGTGFGFDVDGDFKVSGASGDVTMPQATPYVFTATTWTEEIHYVLSKPGVEGGTVVLSFSNIFKADQRKPENYKASDVLWAQQYMQTGTDHVRLSFEHKMAALKIDISTFASKLNSTDEVVLTLEGMPDIDQQEVYIGNYYAAKMKSKIAYGDYYRCQCSYEDNGKALGIVVPEEKLSAEGKQAGTLIQIPFTDTRIKHTGVYTAFQGKSDIEGTEAGYFYLIIPPYQVPADVTPTLWLRNGNNRWSAPLSLPAERTFKAGVQYSVEMNIPE